MTGPDPAAGPAQGAADPAAGPARGAADPAAGPARGAADPSAGPARGAADPWAGPARGAADPAAGLVHNAAGEATGPIPPGSGWPDDPATPSTPIACDAAQVRDLAASAGTLAELVARQSVCRACPRLVEWREQVASVKRRSLRAATQQAVRGGARHVCAVAVGGNRPRGRVAPGHRMPRRVRLAGPMAGPALGGDRRAPATPPVRSRCGGLGHLPGRCPGPGTGPGDRLLPPEPAEHLHRPGHSRDAG